MYKKILKNLDNFKDMRILNSNIIVYCIQKMGWGKAASPGFILLEVSLVKGVVLQKGL